MNEFIEKSKNLKKILQFGKVIGATMASKSNFYYIVYDIDIDIDDYYLLTIKNLHSCTMGLKHTWNIFCLQSHRLLFAIFILVPGTIFASQLTFVLTWIELELDHHHICLTIA